jgi:DNA-binding CsgD family transcriptional regulator
MTDEAVRMLDIVAGFYEALDDAQAWNVAWLAVLRQFDARTGVLYLENPSDLEAGATFLSMPGFDRTAQALYGGHYINLDPYTAHARRGRDTAPFLSQDVIAPERFRETEVWVDFSSKYVGAFHVMAAAPPAGGGNAARAGIHRPHDAPLFTPDDLRRYATLMPHLSRALRLRTKLRQEARIADARSMALDDMTSAVVVVDGAARVITANAPAERLEADRMITLGRRGAELGLAGGADTRRLHRLIADAASGGAGGAMMASAAGSHAPFAVSVSRLPRSLAASLPTSVFEEWHPVIVIMRDVGTAVALDPNALTDLFGLTPVQAEIAMAIVAGATAEAIAEQRGRAVATVRTQVRQILHRTGADSTRQLVAILARLHRFR